MMIATTLTSLFLSSLPSADTVMPQAPVLAQTKAVISTSGNSYTPDGMYMTTPDNCTYRKTQAPGYPPRWILVLNPHHIGKPNSPRHCRGMI